MTLRTAPSPWAELEFDNIILTVHSDVVRGLERPDEVAALWDDIMRGVADLAVVPAKFTRKERFVADVQISHGLSPSVYLSLSARPFVFLSLCISLSLFLCLPISAFISLSLSVSLFLSANVSLSHVKASH